MTTTDDTSPANLRAMTVPQLAARYAEVFGEPTRTRHKQYLIKRILWREQALREGDISERARRRARELSTGADIRLTAPRVAPGPARTVVTLPFAPTQPSDLPRAGSILKRRYKGRDIVVRVLPRGVEYDGQVYRSLSAVAHAVTGAHWSGTFFFKLRTYGKKAAAGGEP